MASAHFVPASFSVSSVSVCLHWLGGGGLGEGRKDVTEKQKKKAFRFDRLSISPQPRWDIICRFGISYLASDWKGCRFK